MKVLILGDKGPLVETLQKRLNAAGYSVVVDGDYGPGTLSAVAAFQSDKGLIVDGVAGPKTTAALLNQNIDHLLKQHDIEQAAQQLGTDIASIHAVKAVESRGNGFDRDGRPVVLYERHVMKKRLKANGFTGGQLAYLQEKFPTLVNSKTGGYKGGSLEFYRLNMAIEIDRTSALESCSWGLFQIMGYHWQALGYDSVEAFTSLMHASEGDQLQAFVLFIQNDPKLHAALKAHDWAAFARRYNGPAYAKNKYDERLTKAYDNAAGQGVA